MGNRIVEFLKWRWELFRLWNNTRRRQLCKQSKSADTLINYLLNYDIQDIRYEETKKVQGVWENKLLVKENDDCIYGFILFGKPGSSQKFILRFWNANKYYAWLVHGAAFYYPDYNDDNDTFYMMDEWDDVMPSKKTVYKLAKKILLWQKQNQK